MTPHARKHPQLWAILLAATALFFAPPAHSKEEHVVLLHGLARTKKSMRKMEAELTKEGYKIHNIGYPSRSNTVDVLSKSIRTQIDSMVSTNDVLHFVTHSMGGIIMRYMHAEKPFANLGRVVTLSPPHQGSEVVDKLGHLKTFKWINGPAGDQLGTSNTNLLGSLPKPDFELGIITGDRSINWILSSLIPGKDDGKVSVEKAKCEGMQDFIVIHATHPAIMKNRKAIENTLLFLKLGRFASPKD